MKVNRYGDKLVISHPTAAELDTLHSGGLVELIIPQLGVVGDGYEPDTKISFDTSNMDYAATAGPNALPLCPKCGMIMKWRGWYWKCGRCSSK